MSSQATIRRWVFLLVVLTAGFLFLLHFARPQAFASLVQIAMAHTSTLTQPRQTVAVSQPYCTPPLCLDWSSNESDATTSVAWGDYDGDGDLDLAVGNGYYQPNRLYRNDNGVLTSSAIWSSTEADASNSRVAWGDVDGDGDLDLAVASFNNYRLYRNDNGILTSSAVYTSTETNSASSIAWGDVDGDGDLDLAVGNACPSSPGCPSVRLYRNDNGVLTSSAVYSSTEMDATTSVAWGDVDGDGDLDLAVGNGCSSYPDCPSIRLYRNANGVLTSSAVYSSTETNSASSIAWGDVDGDGDLDLAVGNFCYDDPICRSVRLYRNNGGVLTSSAVYSSAEMDETRSVTWGDIDRDGDLDLAVGNYGQPDRLYRNDHGMLTASAIWSSNETDYTTDMAWGDVDGDGDLDLAVGNDHQSNRLYRNENGVLASSALYSSTETAGTHSVAWGDVDGDGDLDLVLGNDGRPNRLYRNDNGVLTASAIWSSTEADHTMSVAWGDVDGDGDLDLAVGNHDYSNPFGRLNRLYRNDKGVLTPSAIWSSAEADQTYSVAWGDVDGDGDLDLAVGNEYAPNRLYRNDNGVLTSAAIWSSSETGNTTSVAWGDVDGDGDLDLAVGNEYAPNRLYRNDNGVLTPSAIWSSTESDATWSVAWGDVDSDGDLDLAVGNSYQPNRLYRNDNGILTPGAIWSSIEVDNTFSVTWDDVDGDGDLDLLVGNWGQPARLYRNDNGTLTPNAVWSSTEANHTYSVAWGDVDGDGDLDLATGNDNQPTHLYRNTRDGRTLAGSVPLVRVARPQVNADFFSSPQFNSGIIPITYTLNDPQGDSVQWVGAFYSLSGGGQWLPAVAATGTQTTGLGIRTQVTYRLTGTVTLSGTTAITRALSVTSTQSITITDVDVVVDQIFGSKTMTNLQILLQSPTGITTTLAAAGTLTGGIGIKHLVFDDEADVAIEAGVSPYTGRFRPTTGLWAFDGLVVGQTATDTWKLVIQSTNFYTVGPWSLVLQGSDGVHVYHWDVYRSGFFGQSDNVVFRIEAVPAISNTANSIPGPYLYGSYASSTFPFRVRGTQVRVVSGTQPISNALVYRLPISQAFSALPFTDLSGAPFHTDGQGYLQGRGQLNVGDRLVALYPVTSTEAYTLYWTSAAPTLTGLSLYTVTQSGVQTLTVSSANSLVLFNMDVSLEWDARPDTQFLSQLQHDLRRTSELLYDWTNGQAALGRVNLYYDKAHWNDAHLRIYATNRLRPNATQGGIISDLMTDPVTATAVITYGPGQINLGAVWNRYGESNGNLGEDWPRALAHEIGHYALFLDDDYLGLDATGRLIPIDTCSGTAMSDPYREDYSEFHFQDRWAVDCANTLANKQTGRWDWKTITTFYPWLTGTNTNVGPSALPLDVTQINLITPLTPPTVLAAPIFNLTQNGARVQPGASARAFLYQADRAIDLGAPTLDQVNARGARVGDRVCVYEPSAQRLGCETVAAGDEELALTAQPAWQPDLQITPINSRTLNLTMNVIGLPPTLTLSARLYPLDATARPTITLAHSAGSVYSGTYLLPEPAPQGYVQVWVNEPESRRESVADYGLGGGGAYLHGRGAYLHGRGAYLHGRGAPTQSPDGQVVIFADGLQFEEDAFFALQAVNTVSVTLPGRTQVGQAYRLLKSANAPSLVGASISFYYAGRDVPAGEETFLRVYFLDGSTWQPLPTTVNTDYNVALATIPATAGGAGIYALMSSMEVPLYGPGWDQFSYPVQATRPVTEALLSIDGDYSIVYWYDGSDVSDHWKVYAPGVPGWVADLSTLRFAESYWISLTQSITLSLSGGAAADRPVVLQSPPATYYGTVLGSGGFVPTVDMPVTAWINGEACGQGATQNVSGQIVYSLNVVADGPGGASGCGAPGRAVTFKANGQLMSPGVTWSNDAVWNVSLRREYATYLPLIRKG